MKKQLLSTVSASFFPCILLFAASTHCSAQLRAAKGAITTTPAVTQTAPIVAKGLTKELPVELEYLDYSIVHNMDAAGVERANAALVGAGKFTAAEAAAMIARANISNFPPRLNTAEKLGRSATFHTTGYVQATFLLPFNGIAEYTHLVWVPLADNPSLQAEFSDGKDMFFFSTGTGYKTKPALYTMPKAFVATMKARHIKAQPEAIGDDMLLSYNGAESYASLRAAGYSEAEAGRIMQLTTDDYMPAGFSYRQREALRPEIKKLKAYRIVDYNIGFGMARLYWIPFEENSAASDSLRPKTDEGAFITAMTARQDPADKALTNRKFANKPQWDIYPTVYAFYNRGGTDAQLTAMREASEAAAVSQRTQSSSRTSSSGTTSSGVQYSTGVDMSMFGPGLLGCMAIYPSNGASAMYIVSIYGTSLGNEAAVAAEAYRVSGLADSRYRYQWFSGENATSLQQRYKKAITSVQIVGKYTIK